MLWPSKTAAELAARTGASPRACEHWLAGRCNLSGDALANLLRSDAGLEILSALLGEARPHWWASFKRKVRIERLSEQIEALRIEQEAIQQERIDAQNMHR